MSCKLIMIAWYVHDVAPLTRHTKEFLNNVIMSLRPVPFSAQLPSVNNIPNEIHVITFILSKKIKQGMRLAAWST
jgi:hypothetical protein